MSVDLELQRRCPDCGTVLESRGRRRVKIQWSMPGKTTPEPMNVFLRVYWCPICQEEGYEPREITEQTAAAEAKLLKDRIVFAAEHAIAVSSRLVKARRNRWFWFVWMAIATICVLTREMPWWIAWSAAMGVSMLADLMFRPVNPDLVFGELIKDIERKQEVK